MEIRVTVNREWSYRIKNNFSLGSFYLLKDLFLNSLGVVLFSQNSYRKMPIKMDSKAIITGTESEKIHYTMSVRAKKGMG